ncbi:hypothetical protein EKM03_12550, partial [Flavobacterium sp. GSP6]
MKTKITLFLLAFFMSESPIHSQTNPNKTFDAGSYIIDMGQNTTVAKGLKPYGLVYTLIRDKNVPVYWSINSSKVKDGADFSIGSKAYKGGTFIIAAEDAAILGTLIATWRSNGVVIDGPIAAPFTAPIFNKLTSWPRALLDTENGSLITPYYLNAGIPSSSYVTQSNPTQLTSCGDIYVLPHADPQNWSSAYVIALRNYMHNGGYLWVGCHAVSALDIVSAGNTTPFNFLTEKGLEPWANHNKPIVVGTYNPSANADPVMQFIGKMDASLQNGSERIYLPKAESLWRSTTKVAIYQNNYTDSGRNYTFPENPAALLAYGPTYGDATKGMVMYQAAHEYNSGTTESMIAAQRSFFNFVLLAGIKQQINVNLNSSFPTALTPSQTYPLIATVTGNLGAVTYEWSAIGGGTFSSTSTNPTTYIAPSVIGNVALQLKVTDACGRSNFVSAFMNGGSIVSCAAEAILPSTPTFKNNCGNDIIFTGLTIKEPNSSSICNTTKTYTWSYVDYTTCNPSETPYTRNWSYTYTIKDLVAPIISAAGQNITINSPTTPVFSPPTATDTCGITTVNILSTTQTPGSRPGLYSTTRTWDASDNCGNRSDSVSQTITTNIVSAQCNSDTPLPFIDSTYGNLLATASINGVCVLCAVPNASRLIDTDLNNFATAFVTIGAAGSANYRVTDTDTDYSAGTYVGYRIDTGNLLSLNLLGSITIRTYLNGTLKEIASGSSLLGVGLLNGSGNNYVVGFNTTQDFDAIEISVEGLASLLNTIDVYYPVIQNYCTGPALSCNTASAMNLPAYPVSLEPSHTGISGISLGTIYDALNVISANTNDYATITLTAGVAASGSIAVKDQLTDYSAGTYAGFEIENSNLLNVSALGNISIITYLNGVQQESFLGNNLVVNGSLLNNPGRYKVGFVSTKSFDEVQLSINQTLSLNLGSTRVYSAVFENFCAGPDLVCNTQTAMLAPTYPVYINGINTGIDGLVCALCSINNVDNLIDQNTSNFAQINLTISVGNSGSISVKDQVKDYPIGSFVGFTIENPLLLNVNALDAVTIRTYLNGVLQETKVGNAALVTVGTNLLVGSSLQTIGFVTTKSFDEARITITNTATVSLGVVNVYSAIFQKLCPVILECNKTYALTNPIFPVIIDSGKTGVDGLACVACAVNNTNNVLTANTTDFASVLVTAGVIAPASIAVLDQLSTYPAGSYAGFTIKDLNSLIQLDLFNSLTISTYLDGVFRESKSASLLLNLSLTIPPYDSGPGIYNVGFQSTQSFDEIRISVGSLASVINDINVYGAFINTASTSGGTLQCAAIVANDDAGTAVNGANGGTAFSNVLINDTLNGVAVLASQVVLTTVSSSNAGVTLSGTDVVVAAGTPAGSYTLVYQICEILNPTNCDTATVSVSVTAPAIVANDDAGTPVNGANGGTAFTNVLVNDTLNGVAVLASQVVLTTVSSSNAGITLSGADVLVAAGTPAGNYTLVYQICEIINPNNCDTATVSVTVTAPAIVANDDAGTAVNGANGGTAFSNVLINDTLNGV